jgi:UDP-N-acetylmuramyl pentapeptide phosphotransferase/UDP-N-acetylglucosamine-1-phosphate transferase
LLGAGHLDRGDAVLAAAILTATSFLSGLATGALIPLLRRSNVLDRPNDRSSHATPTPRGGGIAVIGTVLLAWLGVAAAGWVTPAVVPVSLAAGLLAGVCWIDDVHDLSPLTRLTAQAATVAIGLLAVPETENAAAEWLGPPAYFTVLGLLWVWWVNLYNFMDGIDGIAGSEAAAIGGGLLLFAALGSGIDPTVALLAAAILGASLGFLVWNWSPARIFLGDVGSAPLGYLTGYLLIGLAAAGRWKIALILPLYFLADATITLGRRLLRGERIWQAHRQHFYQHAVRQGLDHSAVVKRVIAADLLLIACGWAAENGGGALALAAAVVVVGILLTALARGGRAQEGE